MRREKKEGVRCSKKKASILVASFRGGERFISFELKKGEGSV